MIDCPTIFSKIQIFLFKVDFRVDSDGLLLQSLVQTLCRPLVDTSGTVQSDGPEEDQLSSESSLLQYELSQYSAVYRKVWTLGLSLGTQWRGIRKVARLKRSTNTL